MFFRKIVLDLNTKQTKKTFLNFFPYFFEKKTRKKHVFFNVFKCFFVFSKNRSRPKQKKREVAQWLRRLTADRKVSSSIPALPTVLRVRDISNLCHTVHSAECTGNCA